MSFGELSLGEISVLGIVCSGTAHWGKVCRETVRELQKELYEYGLIFLEK